MFKLKLKGVENTLQEDDFINLADNSDYYSGSDIKTVS